MRATAPSATDTHLPLPSIESTAPRAFDHRLINSRCYLEELQPGLELHPPQEHGPVDSL